MQCTPSFPPPFPFLLVSYSHFLYPPYLKLPPSFIVLFSSRALSHIVSHSIMFLLDAFTFSFYQHSLFFLCLFSSFINFFHFFPLTFLLGFIPTHFNSTPPPPTFLFLLLSSLFNPCFSLPLLLWSLTYLFGADIVVFMRAASPTAAEGSPLSLALVAVLGLVRQMDIWTKTEKKQTN